MTGIVVERSRAGVPAAEAALELPSPGPVSFLYWDYFGIRSTPVLPQQHVKHPGHSAKSARGRIQLSTNAPDVCCFA